MKYLSAHREPFEDVPLKKPARVPVVLVAGAGVYPVAASTVGCPVSLAFLKPDREEELGPACVEAAGRACRRRLQEGE